MTEEQQATADFVGSVNAVDGLDCLHILNAPPASSTCLHCSRLFCNVCLTLHTERLKFEIKCISNGFEKRTENVFHNLDTKLAVLSQAISNSAEKARQDVESETNRVISLLQKNKQRLLDEIDCLAKQQLDFVEQTIAAARITSEQKQQLAERFAETADAPSLFANANMAQVVGVHKAALERDRRLFELEDLLETSSSTGRIAVTVDETIQSQTATHLLSQIIRVQLIIDPSDQQRKSAPDETTTPEWSEMVRLRRAVRRNQVHLLRASLDANCNKGKRAFFAAYRSPQTGDFGRTPLLLAAHHGAIDVARYLAVDCHADLWCRDASREQSTALHLAVKAGHAKLIRLLIDLDDDSCNFLVGMKDGSDNTALDLACLMGNRPIVECLVTAAIESSAANDVLENAPLSQRGMTPLLQAASKGYLEIVQLLVENGRANLSAVDADFRQTALHVAAWNGHLQIVRYLLEKWPQLAVAMDVDNDTPLHLAVQSGCLDVVRCLVESGVDEQALQRRGCYHRTPLLRAAASGQLEIVKYFVLECGADLFEIDDDEDGFTAVHLAAYFGQTNVVEFLLGYDPTLAELRSKAAGKTVLQVAVEQAAQHSEQVVQLLKEKGIMD